MLSECLHVWLFFEALNISNIALPNVGFGTTVLFADWYFDNIYLSNWGFRVNSTLFGADVGLGTTAVGRGFLEGVNSTINWAYPHGYVGYVNTSEVVGCVSPEMAFGIGVVSTDSLTNKNAGLPEKLAEGPLGSSTAQPISPVYVLTALSILITPTTTSVPPPNSFPNLTAGATNITNNTIFPTVLRVLDGLPEFYGIKIEASVPAENGIRINISIPDGFEFVTPPLSFPSLFGLIEEVIHSPLVKKLEDIFGGLLGSSSLLGEKMAFPEVQGENISLAMSMPAGSWFMIDFLFTDLQCDDTGSICTVPAAGGISAHDYVQSTNSYPDGYFDNGPGKLALLLVDLALTKLTNRSYPERATIALWPKPYERSLAAAIPMSVSGMALALVIAALIAWGVWRHRVRPLYYVRTGRQVSLRRVLVEDGLVSLMAAVLWILFMWCTMTQVAVIDIGGEDLYSFSLLHTTRDMWNANMNALAIFVFVFSSMYPFFNLFCMLLFTVVLRWPQSNILRIITYLGKLCLINTFALLILGAALEIKGVAKAAYKPSYYIFIVATVCMFALGNYCTELWRRGTTPKPTRVNEPVKDGEELVAPDAAEPLEEESAESGLGAKLRGKFVWGIFWMVALPAFVVIVGCTIPSFASPAVRFHITKLVSLVEGSEKEFSVYQMGKIANAVCVILLLVSMIFAPAFYALFYPFGRFLGAWCASDVFLLAGVAGLWQLPDFVNFILGDTIASIYMVHAKLLGILLALGIAAILVWVMIGFDLLVLARGETVPPGGKAATAETDEPTEGSDQSCSTVVAADE